MPDFKNVLNHGMLESVAVNERTPVSIQADSRLFHKEFNKLASQVKGIMSDKTRTTSEKASLYDKVLQSIDYKLGAIVASLGDSIHALEVSYEEGKSAALNGGDKMTRLYLATHLRDNQKDMPNLLNDDLRYVQAANEFPPTFYGMKENELNDLQTSALHRHVPELKESKQTIDKATQHASLLVKHFDALRDGAAGQLDNDALNSRFDDSAL
jgi:hypothetical protein